MLSYIISALNGNSCLLTIELLQSLVRFAAQLSLMPENISKLSFHMSELFSLIVESLYYSSLNRMWAFFRTLGKQISLFWRKETPHRPSV